MMIYFHHVLAAQSQSLEGQINLLPVLARVMIPCDTPRGGYSSWWELAHTGPYRATRGMNGRTKEYGVPAGTSGTGLIV